MSSLLYIGVDVSKSQLDYAIPSSNKWEMGRIPNTEEAISTWLTELSNRSVQLVFEPTGSYHFKLEALAASHGISYSLVTSLQSHHFSGVLGQIQRNDKQAARSLSLLGSALNLSPTQPPKEMTKRRKQIRMALNALQKQRQMLRNQLHALDQHLTIIPEVQKALEKALETTQEQIVLLELEMNESVDEEDQRVAKLVQTVKGVGPATAHSLLNLGRDLSAFDSAKQLIRFVGIAPSAHQSGSSVRKNGRITKSGPKDLRANLYMGATTARKYNLACKELYTRLRTNGKPHKVAMVAVMAKMLKQIHAVVKSGVPFDNEYHLKYC